MLPDAPFSNYYSRTTVKAVTVLIHFKFNVFLCYIFSEEQSTYLQRTTSAAEAGEERVVLYLIIPSPIPHHT